ncbi:hypothetical protein [Dyella sp. C11]|uniref:hypothetical protein n=1 Tax=Dyella sp. C11 TaxID=2126991 RepID=UPI000D64ABF9|nr:hypothetical protein [Dyella sp. C11]
MKQFVALALTATLLTGCAASGSLRNTKPTASYAGEGSVADIASCVSDAWSTKPVHLESYTLYTGTTIEIHPTEKSPTIALVDIKPVGDHTVATYYSNFNEDDTWYFKQLEQCVAITPAPRP